MNTNPFTNRPNTGAAVPCYLPEIGAYLAPNSPRYKRIETGDPWAPAYIPKILSPRKIARLNLGRYYGSNAATNTGEGLIVNNKVLIHAKYLRCMEIIQKDAPQNFDTISAYEKSANNAILNYFDNGRIYAIYVEFTEPSPEDTNMEQVKRHSYLSQLSQKIRVRTYSIAQSYQFISSQNITKTKPFQNNPILGAWKLGEENGAPTIYETEDLRMQHESLPSLPRYHGPTRSTRVLNNPSAKWRIAFEVEKEDGKTRQEIQRHHFNVLNGYKFERDGSLSDSEGFEMISPIYNLEDRAKIFTDFDKLSPILNSRFTKKCGGHITLSRRGINAGELFDKFAPYLPLLYALYFGRLKNHYSHAQTKESAKRHPSRGAVNLKLGQNAIEFRLISAVPNVDTLKFRVDLFRYIAEQIDTKPDTTPRDVLRLMQINGTQLHQILSQQYTPEQLKVKLNHACIMYLFLEQANQSEFSTTRQIEIFETWRQLGADNRNALIRTFGEDHKPTRPTNDTNTNPSK